MVGILNIIQTRRSAGVFAGDVDDLTIRTLIEEAAIWAPNHHLSEPWRFTVITGSARERIGHEWALIAANEMDIKEPARSKYIAAESSKLQRAPVIIVVSQHVNGTAIQVTEDHSAVAAAIENLLLAAHGLGMAAHWKTGKMAYHDAFKNLIGVDSSDRIIGLIYLGEGTEPKETLRHRKTEGIIRWVRE
jgi:nitroreductase